MLVFKLVPVDLGPGSSKQLRVVHFQGGIILEPLFKLSKLREPALSAFVVDKVAAKVRDFLLRGGRFQPRFFDHAVPRLARLGRAPRGYPPRGRRQESPRAGHSTGWLWPTRHQTARRSPRQTS